MFIPFPYFLRSFRQTFRELPGIIPGIFQDPILQNSFDRPLLSPNGGAAVFAQRTTIRPPLGQGVLNCRQHTTAMPTMHANKALKRPYKAL